MEIASAEATVGTGRTQVGLSHSAPFLKSALENRHCYSIFP